MKTIVNFLVGEFEMSGSNDDDIDLPVATPMGSSDPVSAQNVAALHTEAEEKRQQYKKENHLNSAEIDPVSWGFTCPELPDGGGGDDDAVFLYLAFGLVLGAIMAFPALLKGFTMMTSAVYRTFRRNDNAAIEEVIKCLDELKEGLNNSKITDIVTNYKNGGFFPSARSKELLKILNNNQEQKASKIGAIVTFLRDTNKNQRMYQVIMSAVKSSENSNQLQTNNTP